MALTQTSKETLWLKCFLSEVGIDTPSVIVRGDNQCILTLAKKAVFHARSKHIDIQHHIAREDGKSGDINIQYLPPDYMVADVLTKALRRRPTSENVAPTFSEAALLEQVLIACARTTCVIFRHYRNSGGIGFIGGPVTSIEAVLSHTLKTRTKQDALISSQVCNGYIICIVHRCTPSSSTRHHQ